MKSSKKTKNSLNQQNPIGVQCIVHLTFDDLADDYLKTANIDPSTYKGDVHTAFVCGMMKMKEINSVGKNI